MRWITSANVACGGHAGNVASMQRCVRLAREFGVNLGAHPGMAGAFGRGPSQISCDELELLLLQQVGALARLAIEEGLRLHHIKLHGSLYHATEQNRKLAFVYLRATRRWWPGCVLLVMSGGRVAGLARRMGIKVWEEAFVDRGYRADGTLVPRGEEGALLTDRRKVLARVSCLLAGHPIESERGQAVRIRARTLCLHGDTPGAGQLARAIAHLVARSAVRTSPVG